MVWQDDMDPTHNPPGEREDRQQQAASSTEAPVRVTFASSPRTTFSPHIVIVDDDPDILDVLEMLFTEDGFRTTCCSSSEDALARLDAEPVQLLITDLRLISGNGLELVRKARARQTMTPALMVLTAVRPAHASVELEEVERLGARVIGKPFDIDDLLGVARELTGWPGRPLP